MKSSRSISIPDLDFEYKLWKSRLEYFISEIELFSARFKSLKQEFGPRLDHLLSLLDDHMTHVLRTRSEIQLHEEEIAYYKKDYPIDARHQHYLDHEALREKIGKITMTHYDIIADISLKYARLIFV